ncbi:MAG: hypothetical protein HC868_15205 [Sphingomonadales bacterium]|nr:hypothetical protein [Sphingomonadales bacterium]
MNEKRDARRMLQDDAFRAGLRSAIGQIKANLARLASVARIDETETNLYWRIAVEPHAENACSFELIVHLERQSFDIVIGPESYESCSIDGAALLPAMVEAIVNGDVTTRRWYSANTGAPHSVDTIVHLPDGSDWQRSRLEGPAAHAIPPASRLSDDHCYAPYARA